MAAASGLAPGGEAAAAVAADGADGAGSAGGGAAAAAAARLQPLRFLTRLAELPFQLLLPRLQRRPRAFRLCHQSPTLARLGRRLIALGGHRGQLLAQCRHLPIGVPGERADSREQHQQQGRNHRRVTTCSDGRAVLERLDLVSSAIFRSSTGPVRAPDYDLRRPILGKMTEL